MFVEAVEQRDAETLRGVCERHLKPGTIIYSDEWGAYNFFKDIGMSHQTVNHSKHYVDPDTGVHTNTIEGTWSAMKHDSVVPVRQRTKKHAGSALLVFIWRRK